MEMFKQLLAVLTHHVSGARCATLRRLGVPVLVMTGPGRDLTGDRVVWSSLNGLVNQIVKMCQNYSQIQVKPFLGFFTLTWFLRILFWGKPEVIKDGIQESPH